MMPRSWAAASPRAICAAVVDRLAHGQCARLQAVAQRLALEQLHYQRAVFETVDLGNVRVIEGGERFGLALESGNAISVTGKEVGQDLHRHVAPQLQIARAIHLAHPTGANRSDDFVGSESGSGGKAHRGDAGL